MFDKLDRQVAEHAAVHVVKDCGFTTFPICPFQIAMKNGIHASKSGYISGDPLERQADCFAGALLLPKILFRKAVDRAGIGFEAIEKLAKECKTSITSTAIRFTQFTDEAIAVIASSGRKIEYCFMSDRIGEH